MGRLLEIRAVFVVMLIALFVGAACSGGPAPSAVDATESPGQIIEGGGSGKGGGGGKLGKGNKGGGNNGGAGGGANTSGGSSGGSVPATATDGSTVSASGETVSEKQQAERARKLAK